MDANETVKLRTWNFLPRASLREFFNQWTVAHYIESGWEFFVPYLFLYLVAWITHLPTPVLTPLFELLHVIHCAVAARYFWTRRQEWQTGLFWAILFLLFLWPGAYLEFPTDPWEHLRKILSWQNASQLSVGESPFRFSYYWSWSLLSRVPILWRRPILDLVAALWQFLLCYQWYRFIRTLEIERTWAYVQVFAFVSFFGTNLFSFRYYALSATPLAYIGYLALLNQCVRWFQWRTSFAIIPTCFQILLMAMNHIQTLLFISVSGCAIFFLRTFLDLPQKMRARVFSAGFALLVLSGLCGYGFVHWIPELYRNIGIDQVSRFGTIRLWNSQERYFQTLGIHGFVSLGFAILLFPRFPLLSTLTLTPAFLLLFPFSAVVLANVMGADVVYRILYAVPTSLMLVLGTKLFVEKIPGAIFKRRFSLAISLTLLLALALPYQSPWRGRLFFQFYTPPVMRTLKTLDQTSVWLKEHFNISHGCWFLSDDATGYSLATHLGFKNHVEGRIHPYEIWRRIYMERSPTWLRSTLSEGEFCGMLVADISQIPEVPKSKIAMSSGHFNSDYGDLRWHAWKDIPEIVSNNLKFERWKTFSIPPYFTYYEPPWVNLAKH